MENTNCVQDCNVCKAWSTTLEQLPLFLQGACARERLKSFYSFPSSLETLQASYQGSSKIMNTLAQKIAGSFRMSINMLTNVWTSVSKSSARKGFLFIQKHLSSWRSQRCEPLGAQLGLCKAVTWWVTKAQAFVKLCLERKSSAQLQFDFWDACAPSCRSLDLPMGHLKLA